MMGDELPPKRSLDKNQRLVVDLSAFIMSNTVSETALVNINGLP